MAGAASPVTAAAISARTMNGQREQVDHVPSWRVSIGEPTCGVWSWRSSCGWWCGSWCRARDSGAPS